jgi:hypothetical protein
MVIRGRYENSDGPAQGRSPCADPLWAQRPPGQKEFDGAMKMKERDRFLSYFNSYSDALSRKTHIRLGV